MSTSNVSGTDPAQDPIGMILEAERRGKQIIRDAQHRRRQRLQQAKHEARQELDKLIKEQEKRLDQKIADAERSVDEHRHQLEAHIGQAIAEIEVQVGINQERVLTMLEDRVVDIRPVIHHNLLVARAIANGTHVCKVRAPGRP
ncbi:vha-10 [Aphelenchoides avenae]|nr:vha-10 [Aphelenchus avenae]